MADDVLADVFVFAWRRLDEAPSDELPWLLGIARGLLANRRRGEARQQAPHDRLAARVHLEAFDVAGQRIATQGQPQPGTK